MKTTELFDEQLLDVQIKLSERYYQIADARKKGKNLEEPFSANLCLMGTLLDNQINQFLTLQQSNLILDKLV
jgi:hypothetical protein